MSRRHNLRGPKEPATNTRLMVLICIAAIIVLCDQLTKIVVERMLAYGERVQILKFFDITRLHNTGAAFSFLASTAGWQRWVLTGLALLASAVIIVMLARYGAQRLFAAALTLILGGAMGNAIDRITRGEVVDFLLLYWHDLYWPAFNVADIAITAGAVLVVIDELQRVRRAR
jgi:signal peptidase II